MTDQGSLYMGEGKPALALSCLLILMLMLKEIKDEMRWKFSMMSHRNPYISALATALMVVIILLCARFDGGQFIYFQF